MRGGCAANGIHKKSEINYAEGGSIVEDSHSPEESCHFCAILGRPGMHNKKYGAIGAEHVYAFDHNVRTTSGEAGSKAIRGGNLKQGPAAVVHGPCYHSYLCDGGPLHKAEAP